MPRKNSKVKKGKKKQYLSLFAGLTYSVLLLAFLTISYFMVLLSVEPKSFPFLTKKIESQINQNLDFGSRIKIDNIQLSLVRIHKLKASFDGIRLKIGDEQELFLPKIEAEFKLIHLLFSVVPSKLKIINPTIDIDSSLDGISKVSINGFYLKNKLLEQRKNFKKFWDILSSIRSGDVKIKNFEIEDGVLVLKNKLGTYEVNIKSSVIKIFANPDSLKLYTNNKINLSEKDLDIEFNGDCQFEKSLKCDIGLFNLVPLSLSHLSSKLVLLSKIDTLISGNVSLEINDKYKLTSFLFNANSEKGNFYYPQFFSQKTNFQNLSISGEMDDKLKVINISNLSVDFDDTKLFMAINIANFMNKDTRKTNVQIKLSEVATNDLEKYWPVFLSNKGIRKWVTTHVSNGVIKDAYTKMLFENINGVRKLSEIEAEMIFSGLNLNYSKDFPEISEIEGIASFTKNNMMIKLISGKVMDREIKSATVSIDNFFAKSVMLNIHALSIGKVSGSLKHISHDSVFSKKIDNYLSGISGNEVDIKLPITRNLTLKDIYIKISSQISNLNSLYLNKDSRLFVDVKKIIGSEAFEVDVNLIDANVSIPSFGIYKEKGVESKIKSTISFDKKNLLKFKNFTWSKNGSGLIDANLDIKIPSLKITNLNLSNKNFGNNDFKLSYTVENYEVYKELKISGSKADLAPFILNPMRRAPDVNGKNYIKNDIQINLDKVYLANKQELDDVAVSINCIQSMCRGSSISAKINNLEDINIAIYQTSRNSPNSEIRGIISDISLLSKGLNISDRIISGNSKIKASLELIDNKYVISGKLNINDGFTVLTNEVVEKVSKEKTFSKLKNKIDISKKIEFDKLKLDFKIQNNIFSVDNLIASSYFMGFTSGGKVNLSNSESSFEGLIVPGYSVNRLFGLGDIPVLGSVISSLLLGEKGGGVFAVRYKYTKKEDQKEGKFDINPASAVAPGAIRNIFGFFSS